MASTTSTSNSTTTGTTTGTSDASPSLHLHTYFRSSCSGRLRIALHLKQLPFTTTAVHLLKGEQSSAAYRALNPSGTVPTLTHTLSPNRTIAITQSTAALEYLDEAFPAAGPALFPKDDVERRAHVRTLVAIVACDTQPLTNSAPIKAVDKHMESLEAVKAAHWRRQEDTPEEFREA
ncbi:putative maleylacetoacetate isomerase [Diplodia seriata]|uniref:Putative maleylacetoacetate isomerase n=1 Tax=Diplodia seriata TaxID=420778 RepID=A0A0G2EB88_9PEZI|nr:putative maleylacetoacetate isomerase [Diplodia seriata]